VDPSGSETVLYSFTNSGGDGQSLEAGLIMDAAGNLYGTAHGGGSFGNWTCPGCVDTPRSTKVR
jgi:hypothetical protein